MHNSHFIIHTVKRTLHYSFITLYLVLIVCSCASNEKWNDIQIVKVAANATAERKTKTNEVGDTIIVSPPYDITVDMEFMDTTSIENIEVCHMINKKLIEEFLDQKNETDPQKAVNIFIERLQNQYEQDDLSPEVYDHYLGEAKYGRGGVINYFMNEDFYGGGAHPTSVTNILRFNTQTGEKIELYEFFTDTCSTSLCDKLTKRLMDNVGVTTIDSLHALGYLDMLDMYVTENFFLDKDSIAFYYNTYDIAPYAVGPTTLTFSYEELKEYIR